MSAFAHIESLFLEAVELPEEALGPWLRDLSKREEAAVVSEVRRMLQADADAGRRLESAIEDAAVHAADSSAPRPGHQLGAYRLVSELGRGGMSTVFLATRSDDEFEQTVAVKVVRQGLAAPDLSKRLLAERQILARLSHPNIARLLDGGTTDDGMPFFVMEVIDGEPIDRFCDRHRLDIPSRIRLFQKTCQAVHFAHRHLVIHRDIKPSNVLVTDVEGTHGEPKLLDFGIAKLLDPASPTEATVSTFRLGTPGYTSPEQIQGLPITTASDTYSLGILLYRLLTGDSPYDLRDSAPMREVEEAILDQPPRPPSLAALGTAAGVAAKRGESPEHLSRRLAGDLDNIVGMALRKEPERRYGSVEHLAEDLDRYLAGLPVRARPDTFYYRTGKLLRRHRLGVLAIASLVALTLVFVTALVLQEARTARQRDRAEQVSAMLVSLFEKAGPSAERSRDLSARDLLDLGLKELGRLDDQAQTQAMLRHTLGTLYEELGIFDQAQELYGQAADQRRQLYGEAHPAVAESLYHLGRACARAGDYDRAEPHFRRAFELRQELLGDDHPDVAVSLNSLALVLHEKGDYEAAEPIYRQAMALSERLNGSDHVQTVKTRSNFALLLLDRGQYREAEVLFRRVLEGRPTFGERSDEEVEALDGLAQSLVAQGKAAEAEPISREVLEIRRKHFGDDHVMVARSLAHLADIVRLRDPDAAAVLAGDALEQRRRWLGDDNAETGESFAISAAIKAQQGRRAEAEALYRRAVDAYAKGLAPNHPMAARPVAELGVLLAESGDCDDASGWLNDAIRNLPPGDRRTEPVRTALKQCLP